MVKKRERPRQRGLRSQPRDRWLKNSKIAGVGGYSGAVAQGDKMMREIGHFIGGKAVKGASGRFGDIFNPNTGEVQARVALADKSDVDKAITNAEAAFPA